MCREVAIVKRRLLCLLLALLLLPVPAVRAADGGWAENTEQQDEEIRVTSFVRTAKLKEKHITLFFTKYVTYEYLGQTLDCRTAGAYTNFEAWKVMSDSDRREVISWYAGYVEQGNLYFGRANFTAMRKWLNTQTGYVQMNRVWADRLMKNEYPELYAFFDGESEQRYPVNLIRGEYPLSGLLADPSLCGAELAEIDELANEYGAAYQAGLFAYEGLRKATSAQRATAITSVSTDLVKLLAELCSGGYRPGGTMFELGLSAYDFGKNTLDFVYQKLKAYFGWGKSQTVSTSAPDNDAATLIKLYWTLRRGYAQEAETAMVFCKLHYETVVEKYAKLCGDNQTQKAGLDLAAQQRTNNYRDAVNQGVSSTPNYTTNAFAVAADPEETYDERYLDAAGQWVRDQIAAAEENARNLSAQYSPARQTGAGREQRERWSKYDAVALPTKPISLEHMEARYLFAFPNYAEAAAADEATLDAGVAELETLLGEAQAYRSFWVEAAAAFPNDVFIHRSHMWTLKQGNGYTMYAKTHTDWGITASEYEMFDQQYYQLPLQTIQAEIEKGNAYVDKLTVQLATAKKQRELWLAEKRSFEASLGGINEKMLAAQEEMEEGLAQVREGYDGLRSLREGYPSWLSDWLALHGNSSGNYSELYRDGVTDDSIYQTVVPETIRALCESDDDNERQQGWQQLDDFARNTLYPQVRDCPSQELACIEERDRGVELYSAGADLRAFAASPLGGDIDAVCDNLNAIFHSGLKSSQTLLAEFNGGGGMADWALYTNTGADMTVSNLLPELIRDLSGENAYMERVRRVHAEVLEQRGDLLRAALRGSADQTVGFIDAVEQTYDYDPGVYKAAQGHTMTAYSIIRYYDQPSFKQFLYQTMNMAYSGVNDYTPVERVSKGSGAPPLSGGDASDALRGGAYAPDLTLAAGESAALTVTVYPVDATDKEVLWFSSDEDVAAVGENGVVTAVRPGSAIITAVAADRPAAAENDPLSAYVVQFSVSVDDGAKSGSYYAAGSTFSVSGGLLRFTCRLGYDSSVDEAAVAGEPLLVVCALYDGDCFLGCCMMEDAVSYFGELSELSAVVPFKGSTEAVAARIFLLDPTTMCPLPGYLPLHVPF